MGIGASGRIVIEVSPDAKRELYSALGRDGLSLKEWFLDQARLYVAKSNQPELKFDTRASSSIGDSPHPADT